MFKKLKDKLAEEVKSSPQRIQQFAQAAQAAVTSASSSISDITNTDLFSIGDNEKDQVKQGHVDRSPGQSYTFQDAPIMQSVSEDNKAESSFSSQNNMDTQMQRRLSNSSFASDISFRLPSYESPSTYHLQSDVDVSASEAEERGFSNLSLDRVTKEQIYSAYRRTQERYIKYRTQYADLARHYKLLERENAKARSVLVETQDKALRRISELREQCTLEQSAKAHLEKALRIEIEEKNFQIDTLNTKIELLKKLDNSNSVVSVESEPSLINFKDNKIAANEIPAVSEITALNNKVEKLEQLVSKYKDSLKLAKEKNSQITTELQIISNQLESKTKENTDLKVTAEELNKATARIRELNDLNEQLQNKINSFDFNKVKEITTLELELQKSHEEIANLRGKIEIFVKNEEEYAISLAENKLSIHKELESKEKEIKSLKDSLSDSQKEIQSLKIVVEDYKRNILHLEEEKTNLNSKINELNEKMCKVNEYESQMQLLNQKYQALENTKVKTDEEIKCLHLQLKQETAEKLAMNDRNAYLESRNSQLLEENSKKSSQISELDSEITRLKEQNENACALAKAEKNKMLEDIKIWESKYHKVESEIQEERIELVKLQSEIEKLLANHESIKSQNFELYETVNNLKVKNATLQENLVNYNKFKTEAGTIISKVNDIKEHFIFTSNHIKSLKESNIVEFGRIKENIMNLFNKLSERNSPDTENVMYENLKNEFDIYQAKLSKCSEDLNEALNELARVKGENRDLESELSSVQKQLTDLKNKYELDISKLQLLQKENLDIQEALQNAETKCRNLEDKIAFIDTEKLSIVKQLDSLNLEKQNVIKATENEKELLQKEIELLREDYKDKLSVLIEEKDYLESEVKKTFENYKVIETLSGKIKYLESENKELKTKVLDNEIEKKNQQKNLDLVQENILLKSQSEKILNNIKELESEISAVRKSHAHIETEKDHLNSIIKSLEEKELKNTVATIDRDSQTNTLIEESPASSTICTENNSSVIEKKILQEQLQSQSYSYEDQNEINRLNTENKRLQSEITGLQTYLANISKENSILNDKLRELFASSESFQHHNDKVTKNLSELESDNLLSKIDELTRENTLLVDENLELKDQLTTQNHGVIIPKTIEENVNENELAYLKEKYNNLLDVKNKLEKRVNELEDIGNSVNGNMMEMQESNTKLRKSNEKLERRLDEALVSLRHLHSLQENTELEYLRNILYEYLTGSGIHSITLAKVLAAVVKFDDRQTQHVLQKEKERQGLLRQLGLL